MSKLPTISLISNWSVDYFEDGTPNPHDSLNTVDSLANWAFDKRRGEGWLAWLQKKFDLPVMNNIACMSYVLEIDYVPYGAVLVINGREFGEVRPPFQMDVTDFIALEDNVIVFRVAGNTAGSFQGVRLVAVPCE